MSFFLMCFLMCFLMSFLINLMILIIDVNIMFNLSFFISVFKKGRVGIFIVNIELGFFLLILICWCNNFDRKRYVLFLSNWVFCRNVNFCFFNYFCIRFWIVWCSFIGVCFGFFKLSLFKVCVIVRCRCFGSWEIFLSKFWIICLVCFWRRIFSFFLDNLM